jgi:hypothetical protein
MKRLTVDLGFRRRRRGAVLDWMMVTLQMILEAMERWTRCAVMRRCRMWGRRAHALPGTVTWSGWTGSGDGELWVSSGALVLCEKSEKKSQGGAPGGEEEGRREERGRGSLTRSESTGDTCRCGAAWRPNSRRERERRGRGMRGTYRRGLDGHYLREINVGVLLRRPFPETEREGEDCGRREMTCGVHLSASRGEGCWAKRSPPALLSFSLIPFHFPIFLISYFLYRICKIPSNQIEQKSKFF